MTFSTRIILHALLEKCPSEEQQSLLKFLAPPEQQAIIASPKTYGDPLKSEEDPTKLLSWIHTSWISPFLRTLPEKEIGLFLACLSPEKRVSVGKDLLFSGKLPSLSPLGQLFLQSTLIRYLTAEVDDLLSIQCLPESPLNDLLALPIETLLGLLDLLGLHDLSVETKQIIDKQKLSKIYDVLSPKQHNYLKILLQSPEPVAFTPIGLFNWNGDKEKLKLLIRQRGANRLAKALYGQDPSLSWYVLHRFDMEKALLIRKLSSPLDNPRAVQILIRQVAELINYTHHKEEIL
jgi:hypothetical protein